jgi:hypothetical protein
MAIGDRSMPPWSKSSVGRVAGVASLTMVGFSELLVQRLHSQAELLKSLTQHSTLVGAGREGAFRELLRELLPRRLEVLEGTVAGPVGKDGPARTKRQVDCMLVDTFTYPTLLRSGNLAVVLHRAVRAIIEVKGEIVAVPPSTPEGEFRKMLAQVGKTRDTLGPASKVLTALLVFDAAIMASTLRAWIESAIAYRNSLDEASARATREERKTQAERDALSPGQLPQYIVTSSGMFVEKLGTQYHLYEMGTEAIVYLLAILLRVSLLPPASSFGVLAPIVGSGPLAEGTMGPTVPSETSSPDAKSLSEAYEEFTAHFALVPTTPIGTIDLTNPPAQPAQEH